jgi:putative ABC transport system permease protein
LKAARTSNDILMGRHTATLSTTRLRNMLVSLQVASALVLVLLAALAIQSAHNISRIDLGFEPDDLVTLNASVVDVTEAVQRQFSRDLLTAIRALPGVTSAAAVSLRPLQHGPIGNDMSLLVEGQRRFPAPDSEKNPIVVQEAITPHYFRTMGTPLIAGRDFDEFDRAAGMPVVIVSERLARTLWPGQNPIGRRVQLADEGVDANGMPRWSTVVGVVGDIRYRGMTDQRQDLYVPYLQASGPVSEVMIRTTGRVPSLLEDVRAAARSRHPRAHVDGFDTMTAVVARATAFWTFNRWLFSVLGLTGLMLAAAGLYGLLAYLVSEKRRELGVRLALGAAPRDLARGVMAQALRLTTAGLGLGITAAFLLARFVENVVYEVRPLDVTLVAVVCTVLLAVAAAASYVPARRATMVNPAETLNFER